LEKRTARQNLKQRIKRNAKKRLKVKAVTLLKKKKKSLPLHQHRRFKQKLENFKQEGKPKINQ
jgi:hypothetical protein